MNLYQKICRKYNQKPKPILFKGKMVQGILEDRKNKTRRKIDIDISNQFDVDVDGIPYAYLCPETGDSYNPTEIAHYQPGDILYVREGWRIGFWDTGYKFGKDVIPEENGKKVIAVDYKADNYIQKELIEVTDKERWDRYVVQSCEDADKAGLEYDEKEGYKWNPGEGPCRWRPGIFMPREVARLFLRVINVKAEKLQDITAMDCIAEGLQTNLDGHDGYIDLIEQFSNLWDEINSKPKPIKKDGEIAYYISFPWEDIWETRTFRNKKWIIRGNPWVWVYTFKRIDVNE